MLSQLFDSPSDESPISPLSGLPNVNERASFFNDVMEKLLDDCINTDVTFVVEEREFKAHRSILAAQSPVFSMLLLGGNFKESIQQGASIPLPDKTVEAFDPFLKFFYTRVIDVASLSLNTSIDIFLMAHEYQVGCLVNAMCSRLSEVISMETVYRLIEVALLVNEPKLLGACHRFISLDGTNFLGNTQFCDLTTRAVVDVLAQDSLSAPEIEILFAVERWQRANKIADLTPIFANIRFELASLDGLTFEQVAPLYKLLTDNNVDLKTIGTGVAGSTTPRLETSNMVFKKEIGAIVLNEGGVHNPDSLLQSSKSGIDASNYTFVKRDGYIVVKLFKQCLVDSLSFKAIQQITNQQNRYYNRAYYDYNTGEPQRTETGTGFIIWTSTDGKTWKRLTASPGNEKFSDRLLLMFRPQLMQYVKFSGDLTGDGRFCLISFECPAKLTQQDRLRYFSFNRQGDDDSNEMLSTTKYRTLLFQESPQLPPIAL